jgi:IS5 family transposase
MRQDRTIQATIFEVFAQHEIGCELKAMSQWLDGQRQLTSLVAGDLRRQGVRETGRHGLPAESVLRCALLKQQRLLSYEELAFHLEDSASFRAFARLPLRWSPKKSVLHQTIAAIRAETWEAINQALLASAKQDRLESSATVRLDSTVTAALMHEPSDSTLLSDAVRVMTRLLQRGDALPGAPAVQWRDRRRLAKKRPAHRVQPRARQKAPALSRADHCYPGQPRRTASDGHRAGRGGRDGCRALACRGRALPAADRARYCPDSTPRARRRDRAGQ